MDETTAPEEQKRGPMGVPRSHRGKKIKPSKQVKRLHRKSLGGKSGEISLRKYAEDLATPAAVAWLTNKGYR